MQLYILLPAMTRDFFLPLSSSSRTLWDTLCVNVIPIALLPLQLSKFIVGNFFPPNFKTFSVNSLFFSGNVLLVKA